MQPDDPGQDLTLGGRYRIHPDKPLPTHDTPAAFALEASDLHSSSRRMMAMVCKPGLIPRLDIIPQLSRFSLLPMVNPADAGPVGWPETGGRRFAVLFDQIAGAPLQAAPERDFEPLREDQIFYKVLKPIMPAIKELAKRSIRHRAIRADNLYYANAGGDTAILGECVSSPPGLCQPAVYEPIEAAMADPAGRGPGAPGDDLYALGVLIVVLLCGGNPVKGMSDDELIAAKIARGSYAALIRDRRLSLRMIEPLRGLLSDDPKERWTANDLELWVGGRQLSPQQPALPPKASRTLAFQGKDYLTRAGLSHAMGRQWEEAGRLVQSGEVETWLKRSYGDDEGAKTLRTLTQDEEDGEKQDDRVTAAALIVLNPAYPLRYRSLSAQIDGLPTLLAVKYGDEAFRTAFSEMMNAKLPLTYLQATPGRGTELVPLMKTFEMIGHFINRPQIGEGLERALYEANRGWPCQSPMIADYCACEIEDLLPALENAVRSGAAGQDLVDRHIAAFCAARGKNLADKVPRILNPTVEAPSPALGVLILYAEVQKATDRTQRFPALTAWLAAMMTPVVQGYHNRAIRERLNKEVERVGGQGDPIALLAVLDNPEERHADSSGFAAAQQRHALLETIIDWLAQGGLTAQEHVMAKSQQAATFVSAMAASATLVLLAIFYVA